MPLLLCPDCGKEFSSRLDACPVCCAPASAAEAVSSSGAGATLKQKPMENMLFVRGKYELVRKLGRGSFGEVWQARDLEAGDAEREVFVALKLLPPEVAGSPSEITRVRKNFQQVHGLHHQNIVAHLAMFQDGDDCALVMEFVDGVTLSKYRLDHEDGHGAFPLAEALRICRQIAEGLDFAHSRKVAHRDVKPDNIMITGHGDVKLLDFGLAAEIRSAMIRVSRQSFDVSGTRPYMAPEQWLAKTPPSPASDQYALGVVLYELLSGRPPFESEDFGVLKACVLHDAPSPLAALSDAQNRALLKGLAKAPSERFANCMEFMDAVGNERQGEEAKPKEGDDEIPVHDAVKESRVAEPEWFRANRGYGETYYALDYTNKGSLLRRAALAGEVAAMEWLVENGTSVNARDVAGMTPMHCAAQAGRLDSMEWLKANGADINAKDVHGVTPMLCAAQAGKSDAMEWLKANGADVHAKDSGGGTPMHRAAVNGHIAAMHWLKANDAEMNAQDLIGNTPMHWAASNSHIVSMQWLKLNGAYINAKNHRGRTPLDVSEDEKALNWIMANGGKSGKDF